MYLYVQYCCYVLTVVDLKKWVNGKSRHYMLKKLKELQKYYINMTRGEVEIPMQMVLLFLIHQKLSKLTCKMNYLLIIFLTFQVKQELLE